MQMVSARPTSSLAKLAHRRVQSLAELPTLEQAKGDGPPTGTVEI
jgi:hypothetical protein